MAVILAALSSAVFGVSDFMGGLAARRADVLGVLLVAQLAGVVPLLVFLPVVGGAPSAADAAWGAIGGLAGTAGLLLLYRALAVGAMTAVAPLTAVVGALVPLTYGLLTGDRLGALAGAGVVIGLGAIALTSWATGAPDGCARGDSPQPSRPARPPRSIAAAVAAGVGFGAFYILLSNTGDDAGLWPLVAARATSLPLVALAVLATASRVPRTRHALVPSVAAGSDMVANGLFLLALGYGSLSVVSVLSSLYPATTVFLARVVLHERMGPVRLGGLVAAGAAVVLISIGD